MLKRGDVRIDLSKFSIEVSMAAVRKMTFGGGLLRILEAAAAAVGRVKAF